MHVFGSTISEKCKTTWRNPAIGCPLCGPGGPFLNSEAGILVRYLNTGPFLNSEACIIVITYNQCWGSKMFIPDPGSEVFHPGYMV
jgi:hypothetical protein